MTGAPALLELQALAGNRAVADLVARNSAARAAGGPRRALTVQRCGGEVHEGCACAREGDGDQVQRAADGSSPAPSSAEAATPDCPGLPDPHGEWMTEPWLCEMRAEPLYSNRRLLAPGARGRSVELLHRVLQDWICEKTMDGDPPTHTLADWRSSVHTQATSDVVKEFQTDVGATMREGIVGPETLSLLDGHVGGPDAARIPADCRPEPARVPSEACPPRDAGEEEGSASDRLILEQGTPRPAGVDTQRQVLSLIGFTADDASIDKGPASAIDKLADLLDPGAAKPSKPGGGRIECWEVESATAYGFADCAEFPSLGRQRAETVSEAVATRVPGADVVVDVAPDSPAGNATAEERRLNRSVLIVVERRLRDETDLSGGGLDALLEEFERRRGELEGRYGERVIELAGLLAAGANDEYLGLAGVKEVADMPYPGDCIDPSTYPWSSARDHLGDVISASVDSREFCQEGIPPSIEQLMEAVESLQLDMANGLWKLRLESARGAIASASFGCPCEALQELWRRSLDGDDVYHAMADHHNFEGDPTKELCTTA